MRTRTINIIGYRRLPYLFSALLIGLSLFALLWPGWGLRLGIDFTGGSLLQVRFSAERPLVADIRAAVPDSFGSVDVAPVGDDGAVLRFRDVSEAEHQALLQVLNENFGSEGNGVIEDRFTTIGPTIGAELRQKAVWALVSVLVAIVLYVAWAFRRVSRPVPSWQYGAAAIVALFHDVIITLGIFALLGRVTGVEVGVLFITALLTVLGFSVHDSIVVFDRIRENLSSDREETFPRIVNHSLNETMSRSINTSVTTLLVLMFTLIFGGETIRYFVLALIVGIVFGTYSSIFVAAPTLVSWFSWREKRIDNGVQ